MKKIFLVAVLFLGVQSSLAQIVVQPIPNQDAVSWLKTHEEKLKQITEPNQRRNELAILTPAAFTAGETEKARNFAAELMALGEQTKSMPGFGSSNYGQATFVGNTVLGLIALQANDVEKAKAHLLASARIEGSPVLKSFGPNMLLAKQLLEKGEREPVIEYFDLCAKFWTSNKGKLDQWKTAVQKGETPDFGANLKYLLDDWRFVQ